jgi:hypothetical protein
MNNKEISDFGTTDLICLWADWLMSKTDETLTRKIAEDIIRPDSRIGAALGDLNQSISPLKKEFRSYTTVEKPL